MPSHPIPLKRECAVIVIQFRKAVLLWLSVVPAGVGGFAAPLGVSEVDIVCHHLSGAALVAVLVRPVTDLDVYKRQPKNSHML